MLKLMLGRAGCGKTTEVFRRMSEKTQCFPCRGRVCLGGTVIPGVQPRSMPEAYGCFRSLRQEHCRDTESVCLECILLGEGEPVPPSGAAKSSAELRWIFGKHLFCRRNTAQAGGCSSCFGA